MKPIYDRDGITLYHGDCLAVLPMLGPVDHVITDPPYSRDLYLSFRTNKGARGYPTANHLALANERIGAMDDVYAGVAPEFIRMARRWIIVFHDAESGHLWRDVLGGLYVRAGVWVKVNPVPQISGDRPAQGFESMTIAHALGAKRWNGGGQPAVWRYPSANGKSDGRPDHPCPKPLPLMMKLIEQFTDPGDLILDPFCGSGTTLVAARELGRRAIGIEISEEYAETAVRILEHGVKGAAQVKRGQLPLVTGAEMTAGGDHDPTGARRSPRRARSRQGRVGGPLGASRSALTPR